MSIQLYLCRQCGFLCPASEMAGHEDECAVRDLPASMRWAKYPTDPHLATPGELPKKIEMETAFKSQPEKRGKRGTNSYGDTPDA